MTSIGLTSCWATGVIARKRDPSPLTAYWLSPELGLMPVEKSAWGVPAASGFFCSMGTAITRPCKSRKNISEPLEFQSG